MVKYDSCLAVIHAYFYFIIFIIIISVIVIIINVMCVVSGKKVAARPSILKELYMSAHKTASEAR